jgi:hypothetical protein
MKVSIFTTIGNIAFKNPDDRGDAWKEALHSYCNLADEVIVVDGGSGTYRGEAKKYLANLGWEKVRWYQMKWPIRWGWDELPRHYNFAMSKCRGDWVMPLPCDQVFHEKDREWIRKSLNAIRGCIATFHKYSFITWDKYYQKGEYPLAICKKEMPNIGFGLAKDKKTDLCWPIFVENINDNFMGYGEAVSEKYWYRTGIHFYNYDYTFRTMDQAKEAFWRGSYAWHKYFKEWKWGDTKERAWEVFVNMKKERYASCPHTAKIEDHPKCMQRRIRLLKPEEFGYNGYGIL